MTSPSNETFYQWGYHNPSKDPILPLSEEQRTIFEKIISTTDGEVRVGYELLPSGEGLQDPSKYYVVATDPDKTHISAPALYPHPNGTGDIIDRGNYYFSSGNYTVWPNPVGQDRYSAYWWDVSGIYFTPDIYGSGYASYPTASRDNVASILLFDDLDHDAYWGSGIIKINTDKKYLLWLTGRNVDQMSIFHYGKNVNKTIQIPLSYNEKKNKTIFSDQTVRYFYSHFSNATHEIIDKGFDDFQIFYNYIHYIPKLKNENQLTHEIAEESNQIPFLSNAKSVYLYSVYGSNNLFVPVLRAPSLPFPPAKREDEDVESKDLEYYTQEELEEKFNAVSGLLGL